MPFSVAQFLTVFAEYNRGVWPAQVALYGLGLLLAGVGYAGPSWGPRAVAFGLAALWAWVGGVYHLLYLRQITPGAVLFGLAFLVQALLFAMWGLSQRAVDGGRMSGSRAWTGGAILAYAFVGYPLLGWFLGHRYPESPTFGVPCPTTIATFGLLVWMQSPPWWLFVVPFLWAIVGISAAFQLGVPEDLGLVAAALVAGAWSWRHRARHRGIPQSIEHAAEARP